MGNKNISICWPHSVVFFCLLLLTPSLCQDDSDSDDDGDSTSAVYIVTLRQAPSHFQDELKSVGKGFRHAPPGTRRTRTRLQKPRPANVTKTGRGHGSYIIRFHDLLLKRVFKGEKYLKLYSYHYLINGFSVLVTPQQAEKLSRRREVSNVVLDYSLNKSTPDLRIVQIFDSDIPKRTINFHWNNPLSFTASRDWYYRQRFFLMGLRSVTTDFGDGTTMHCWVPKTHHPCKPALVLVHGFGANAMWQFGDHIRSFTPHFNVYVPDLLFFGGSFSSKPERTEKFQAQCLMRLLKALGIDRMMLVGISYGGFVGYSLAAQFPEAVDRLVLCCTGVCLEENDLKHGLFKVSTLEEATSILVPQTPDKLRLLMRMSFVKPAMIAPSFFLQDFINVMCRKYAEQKKELIESLLKDRQLSAVPKITQPTLVVWGELDQVFPLELGYRLEEYIGDSAQIAVIKNAGHAVNLEKPREFEKHLHSFLIDTD